MARRFVREAFRRKGLSDLEWKLFEEIFPKEPEKRGKGMPHGGFDGEPFMQWVSS